MGALRERKEEERERKEERREESSEAERAVSVGHVESLATGRMSVEVEKECIKWNTREKSRDGAQRKKRPVKSEECGWWLRLTRRWGKRK